MSDSRERDSGLWTPPSSRLAPARRDSPVVPFLVYTLGGLVIVGVVYFKAFFPLVTAAALFLGGLFTEPAWLKSRLVLAIDERARRRQFRRYQRSRRTWNRVESTVTVAYRTLPLIVGFGIVGAGLLAPIALLGVGGLWAWVKALLALALLALLAPFVFWLPLAVMAMHRRQRGDGPFEYRGAAADADALAAWPYRTTAAIICAVIALAAGAVAGLQLAA